MPYICPNCSTANADAASICGACATRLTSSSTALVPVQQQARLPVLSQSEKATLGSMAIGLAALAMRVGVSLWQHRATGDVPPEVLPAPTPPTPVAKESWVVRRRWVVGDESGRQQWGEEEIEIEPPHSSPTSLKLNLRRPPR